MHFSILGKITDIQVIATGRSIRNLKRLEKRYGKGRGRKYKGNCKIVLRDGQVFWAEIHWYEAHGIGKKEIKIKRILQGE